MEPSKKANNANWIYDFLLPVTIRLARDSGWSKKMLARWLGCWLKGMVPPDLLRWLCLIDQNRIVAEKTLEEYLKTHVGHMVFSRRIVGETRISRNTAWAKTIEKASGICPLTYYNSVRLNVPDRFLYGALNWLVRAWHNEIRRYRDQLPDAETRLKRLEGLLRIPALANSPPVPFQVQHLVRLYDLHAFELVDCLQRLQRQEDAPFGKSDSDNATLRSIFVQYAQLGQDQSQDVNHNNLMELLVLLQSANTLRSIEGWRLIKTEVDDPQNCIAPPKPTIFLENDRFQCQIRKGSIQNLDRLSKAYRGENASGFEPDIVFLFSKKSGSPEGGNAIIFLGDAKNYTVSSHDVAVRDKLLNVFAFARALGIRLQSDADPMIKFHLLNTDEPVPSFLLFFPPVDDDSMNSKGERTYRNVIEKFSISCFDCNGERNYLFCEGCPANLKKSFQNIIYLISNDSFQWPLILKSDNSLIEVIRN